jgi:hypothetical protein
MRKYLSILMLVLVLFSSGISHAAERGSIGLNYFNSGYQFTENLREEIPVKEVSGSYRLTDELSIQADYNFGKYDNYVQGDLKQASLGVIRDFARGNDELSLGISGNYSSFSTKLFTQELFRLTGNNVEVVTSLEKEVADNLSLFAGGSYSLTGNYKLGTSLLEEGVVHGYETGNNYKLQAGLNWEAVPDLKVRLGYRLGTQKLTNSSVNKLKIQDYDLSQINKLNRGVFLGVESKF